MPLSKFQPCIPTRGKVVPAGREWLHELKMDGYRLIVQRDGDRVRLYTRNGYDWSHRYPWIVESALRTGPSSSSSTARLWFSVLTGTPTSTHCTRENKITKCSYTPSTCSHWTVTTFGRCPCRRARRVCTPAGAPRRWDIHRPARAGRDRSGPVPRRLNIGLEAWYRSAGTDHTAPAAHRIG